MPRADPEVLETLAAYAEADRRIKVVYREEQGGISRASNSALEIATGKWVAMLDHDDLLAPQALLRVAETIKAKPQSQVIYSDEDKITQTGGRYGVYFKPDFSLELFRSQNYLNHLTVHRTENVRAVGGWRAGFEGSQDYDLSLRIIERIPPSAICHIPDVLYHWRVVAGSTALALSEKSYAYTAGLRALNDHVNRLKLCRGRRGGAGRAILPLALPSAAAGAARLHHHTNPRQGRSVAHVGGQHPRQDLL